MLLDISVQSSDLAQSRRAWETGFFSLNCIIFYNAYLVLHLSVPRTRLVEGTEVLQETGRSHRKTEDGKLQVSSHRTLWVRSYYGKLPGRLERTFKVWSKGRILQVRLDQTFKVRRNKWKLQVSLDRTFKVQSSERKPQVRLERTFKGRSNNGKQQVRLSGGYITNSILCQVYS